MGAQATIARDFLDAFTGAFDAHGLDLSQAVDSSPMTGRNGSAMAELPDGGRVHLKRFEGADGERRFARTLDFEAWQVDHPLSFRTPALVASSHEERCVAFEFMDSDLDVGEAIGTRKADPELVTSCVRAIASLHSGEVLASMDRSTPEFPPGRVGAISMAYFENATFGEIALWQLLQHDAELIEGLVALAAAPFTETPIHGDFRPDQILGNGGELIILDWEEFRAGDPCRDLGTFLGEVLYHGIRGIATGAAAESDELGEQDIIRHGSSLVGEVRPLLAQCRDAYPRHLDEADISRLVRYMGWHLFDRGLVSACVNGRLSANDRALAGIGRNLLLGGSKYADVLGLGGRA